MVASGILPKCFKGVATPSKSINEMPSKKLITLNLPNAVENILPAIMIKFSSKTKNKFVIKQLENQRMLLKMEILNDF